MRSVSIPWTRRVVVIVTVMVMVLVVPYSPVTASQPQVTIENTSIYGTTVEVANTTVAQYLGLRFAHPPVGFLRFAKPLPATWAVQGEGGMINATVFPNSCPGLRVTLPQDEDCLFLNLYVPQGDRPAGDSGVLPVMVWIHGGGFVFGSGSMYDGSQLAAEGNVIVVTPNYRVGPLGFLSTGDNSSLGNYGLWDQSLAMKWVKDNIGHFGGDVTRITLLGESAGAASISYHMTSPHSRGLFHRVILQSGSRLNPWAMDHQATSHAQTLARMSSCSTESSSEMVECLRAQHWSSLKPQPLFSHVWGPVVDDDFVLPFNSAVSHLGREDVMIGVNNREGGVLLGLQKATGGASKVRKRQLANVGSALNILLPSQAQGASPTLLALTARVLDCVYRGPEASDTEVTDEELEQFVGDTSIILGSQQFLDAVAGRTSGRQYQYYFNHYPDIPAGEKGMDHGMDQAYTFGFGRGLWFSRSAFYNQNVSERDQLLGRRFRTLLTNFAHSGNPNQPVSIPDYPEWPAYDKGSQSYLNLTFDARVASHLKGEVMRVWGVTVPALLSGQGPLELSTTPWAHCSSLVDPPSAGAAQSSLCLMTLLWCLPCLVLSYLY